MRDLLTGVQDSARSAAASSPLADADATVGLDGDAAAIPRGHWSSTSLWVVAIVVGLACYAAQQLAYALRFPPLQFTTIWFPAGIVLGTLLVIPPRFWWGPILGAGAGLILSLATEVPLDLTLIGTALTITYRGLCAASLRRVCHGTPRLDNPRHVTLYLLLAVLLAPALFNLLSAWIVVATGWKDDFLMAWRTLFLADAVAHVTVAPAILAGVSAGMAGFRTWSRWFWLEAIALGLGLVAIGFGVVGGVWLQPRPGLTFVMLPGLLWATVRFGPGGTSVSLLAIAWLATWHAVRGRGPFTSEVPAEDVLSLQLFLLAMSAPLLLLAALIRERQRIGVSLLHSEQRYREVVESQADLICRYLPDTTITFVNEAYCRYFSRKRAELIGQKFLNLIPQEARAATCDHIQSLIRDPRVRVFEHEVLLGDGSVGWQQWVDYAIRDSEGNLVEFQGIGRDISDRRRAEDALRQKEEALRNSYTQVQDLAGRLIAAQEAERTRIARELHDDISQQLAALSIGLSRISHHIAGPSELQQDLATLQEQALQLGEAIRDLSHELHPGILQHAGLVPALKAHSAEFRGQHGIELNLDLDECCDGIPHDVSLCLYRVAQEALHNAAHHASARQIWVSLTRSHSGVELVVTDDGEGFDVEAARGAGGIGLISLEERARLVQGRLSINTKPQFGTEVRVQIPLQVHHELPYESTTSR
jgi:PAS domain S-box-containing protein